MIKVSAYQDEPKEWEIYVQTDKYDITMDVVEASRLFHDIGNPEASSVAL